MVKDAAHAQAHSLSRPLRVLFMEPAIVDIGVRQNHVAVRHGRCSMESWAQLENRGEIPFLPRQVSLARRALEAGVRLDARSRARWEKKKIVPHFPFSPSKCTPNGPATCQVPPFTISVEWITCDDGCLTCRHCLSMRTRLHLCFRHMP